MLFPKYLYGLHRDVKNRCTKLVKTTTSLDAYGACVLSMGMVDTEQAPGLFMLNGPNALFGRKENFQLYLPLEMMDLKHRGNPMLLEAISRESLKTAWGTLLLAASAHCAFWFHEGFRDAFLKAVFAHWDEIGTVGPRFAFLSSEPQELLELPTMIRWALFHIAGLTSEQGRRTNWTELFHEMKARWEQEHAAPDTAGQAGKPR